ncbi:3'-5' exonuclease [Streptomyces luteolifulvus]|uniref:3'-5' exonuclease n=1 Tax=Streptomyces luteolifulvus TaxID=2615112 RepID=A0A6H9V355_9ACTN|nr:3'-5' exonuclease [Streptomyces luteolifulvus]KAB1146766.1 3'-5' exonuclease [Streptomyces luteolifulvus]
MSTNSPTAAAPPLVFGDTETTGLDPFMHDAWEFALIVRRDGRDEEHVFRIRPDLAHADPKALEINRYHERTAADGWTWDEPHTAATRMYSLLNGAVLIGSNPSFDADMIRNLFARYYDVAKPWHYRALDIATFAAGHLYGQAERMTRQTCDAVHYSKVDAALGWPWSSYRASELVGIPRPSGDAAHTALGDARWARDVWDAVTKPDAFYTATDEQLGAMAGEALSRFHGGAT